MSHKPTIHGMSTVSFWADDVKAAAEWYTKLLGIEPYFVRPTLEAPQYIEFRIGDYQQELGIISSAYLPEGTPRQPAGVVLYWHVDDVAAMLKVVESMGAIEYQPLIEREAGFVTASVVDPFGNILGLMYSTHYKEMQATLHKEG